MTPANFELVRAVFVAGSAGDFSSAEWAHPEIEFAIAEGAAGPGGAGPPAVRRSLLSP